VLLQHRESQGLRVLIAVANLLFVLAVPLAIVLTQVRMMMFDPGYYERGYQRHGVAGSTGMTLDQLSLATTQIQEFFHGGPPVSLVVSKERGREPLFNAREQKHMEDVRALLNRALGIQEASLLYLFGAASFLLVARRSAGVQSLARWLAVGAGVTLAIFIVVGLLAALDFRSFWTQFHLLSFDNDLWRLDPRTDYLIRLFPESFWFEAVLELGARSLATAMVLLILAQAALWSYARTKRARVRSIPTGEPEGQ